MFSFSILCLKSVIELGSFFLISKYFGDDTLAVSFSKKMKYGKWSDNCVIQISEGACAIFVFTLQKKLAIIVAVCCEKDFGKVIFGIS